MKKHLIGELLPALSAHICQRLADGRKAAAVRGAGAKIGQCALVLGRAIALVARKAIGRVERIKPRAVSVAADFGEYRGGGNSGNAAITFNDGFGAVGPQWQAIAIHLHMRGLQCQPLDRAAHGEQGGLQNI